jgi:hypothetical protein
VRDAGRVHRAQRLEQRGEEPGAIGELVLVRAQRRARYVLEREMLLIDEPVRARHAGHTRELLVDRVLAAQQIPIQRAEGSGAVRSLDDRVAPGRRVELDGGLVAAAEDATLAARDRVA